MFCCVHMQSLRIARLIGPHTKKSVVKIKKLNLPPYSGQSAWVFITNRQIALVIISGETKWTRRAEACHQADLCWRQSNRATSQSHALPSVLHWLGKWNFRYFNNLHADGMIARRTLPSQTMLMANCRSIIELTACALKEQQTRALHNCCYSHFYVWTWSSRQLTVNQ